MPRKRSIQYAAAFRLITGVLEYWIARQALAMTLVLGAMFVVGLWAKTRGCERNQA
jgi:hypothetical protein